MTPPKSRTAPGTGAAQHSEDDTPSVDGTRASFGVTLGAGNAFPQGRWHELPGDPIVSFAETLRNHVGTEAWFCLSRFKAGEVTNRKTGEITRVPDHYRHGDVFDYAVGAGVDVDTDGHRDLTPDERETLIDAAREGTLPGDLFYTSPAGGRVVRLFDEPVFDPAEFQRMASEFEAEVHDALDVLGLFELEADSQCTADRARFYYTPNCYAKGRQRKAEVIRMERRAPVASDRLRERTRAKPREPYRPMEEMAEGDGRNNLISGRCWKWRKLGLELEHVRILAHGVNQGFREPMTPGEVDGIVNGKAGIVPATAPARGRTLRERLEAQRGAGPRIPTGIDLLDQMLRGGLRMEKLLVLGGAPGAGKTTLMLQIARNMARAGVAVAFVASDEEASGLDSRNLQSVGIGRDDAEDPTPATIDKAVAELGDLPLLILEDCTVEDAFDLLAEEHSERPRCVMLDSLQTCQTALTRDIDNPRERIDDVVKTAKRLARQPMTRAVVVATSELARGAYRSKRSADATNDLAAFKESGGVEYAAHAALVLRTVEGTSSDIHAALVKNRLGQRGDFMLYLNQQTATFADGVATTGGATAAEQAAAFRGRVVEVLDTVVEAGEGGITSNRVCQRLRGRRATTLDALDELRSAGVIARNAEKGPWRASLDWKQKWAELQQRMTHPGC